jgi:transposase-like protein
MGGAAPRFIITDECSSMDNAIREVFPAAAHRLCLWHIMNNIPQKVGPDLKTDEDFHE